MMDDSAAVTDAEEEEDEASDSRARAFDAGAANDATAATDGTKPVTRAVRRDFRAEIAMQQQAAGLEQRDENADHQHEHTEDRSR